MSGICHSREPHVVDFCFVRGICLYVYQLIGTLCLSEAAILRRCCSLDYGGEEVEIKMLIYKDLREIDASNFAWEIGAIFAF